MNGTTIGKGNIDELLVLNERNKRNNHLVRKDRGTVGTDRMEQPLVQNECNNHCTGNSGRE